VTPFKLVNQFTIFIKLGTKMVGMQEFFLAFGLMAITVQVQLGM
jgi:hypothetical protein